MRAREALDALRAEDLPGKGRVREFYFRLSEIVRGYLGERYGFDALESTTPELLESLRRLHTPGLADERAAGLRQRVGLRALREGRPPTRTPARARLELAYSIVQATTPTRRKPCPRLRVFIAAGCCGSWWLRPAAARVGVRRAPHARGAALLGGRRCSSNRAAAFGRTCCWLLPVLRVRGDLPARSSRSPGRRSATAGCAISRSRASTS